jgi:hypothetical protein
MMEKVKTIMAIVIFLMMTGCYAGIRGTVVDAENAEPIEGAVVLVEWWKTKGLPGMTVSEIYKVQEALTDKEGKVDIEGVGNPFIELAGLTIYKKGYVAWSNMYLFPSRKNREDFKWRNNYIFKLERFKPEYSYWDHTGFIDLSTHSSKSGEKKTLMEKAYRWEELKASEEFRRMDEEKRKKLK